MERVKKYLVTRIDGCTLEVDTFFLSSDSESNIVKWITDQLGDEAEITTTDRGIFGKIPCDYNNMLKDTEIWIEPVDIVITITL